MGQTNQKENASHMSHLTSSNTRTVSFLTRYYGFLCCLLEKPSLFSTQRRLASLQCLKLV